MDDHIIFSYFFDGNGKAKPLVKEDFDKKAKGEKFRWIHMDLNNQVTRGALEKEFSDLDPFIVEALLADETRPRVTKINEGALVFLRGVNLNENSHPEDMVAVRLWADKGRIISVRRRKLKAVFDLEERIRNGNAPKDVGEFVSVLISILFERMAPSLTNLDDEIDDIEEKILETASIALRENIVDIRKKAIMFRRYMAPQKDAIAKLRTLDLSWLSDRDKRSLEESYNHVSRYVEDLDAIRERAQIVKDELANILSDRLNKNMYVLSIVAAIFLPLGFLTGLLGINIAGIPGSDNPDAFFIFNMILLAIVALQIVIFKKNKWF